MIMLCVRFETVSVLLVTVVKETTDELGILLGKMYVKVVYWPKGEFQYDTVVCPEFVTHVGSQ